MKLPNRQKTQFSLIYLFIALMVVLSVQSWLRAPQTVDIPMSQFLALVREAKVVKVTLGEREIQGIAKPGSLPMPPPGPGDRLRALLGPQEGPTAFTTARMATETTRSSARAEAAKVEFSPHRVPFWRDISWVVPSHMAALGSFDAPMAVVHQALSSPLQGQIMPARGKTTFADVPSWKSKASCKVVDFLKNPQKSQASAALFPSGLLSAPRHGTRPGPAVAGEADVPFFFLSGPSSGYVVRGASRVRDLFEQAKEKAPCIVFIDELDAIGKTRAGNTGFLSGHDEREQTLNQLLAEMDGFDSSKGVIIMAATNRPEVLDAALLRAGRFDRQVVVDKPDVKGREAILFARPHVNWRRP